ncbi:MAG TPA: 30S ribosomal protein S20, partial [Anaerolineales bacterium]|nr:30S ribosomal protein S20 [Anaerolineales bacterium]
MANIQSQIKRNRQNEKRRLRNRNVRGAARTADNAARKALAASTPETKDAVL